MKFWDILEASQYMQIFSVYVTNIYGQNIPIARGTRSEIQEYDLDEGDLFYQESVGHSHNEKAWSLRIPDFLEFMF